MLRLLPVLPLNLALTCCALAGAVCNDHLTCEAKSIVINYSSVSTLGALPLQQSACVHMKVHPRTRVSPFVLACYLILDLDAFCAKLMSSYFISQQMQW
jgi:hypothetical protein